MKQTNVIVETSGTNDGEITFSSAKGIMVEQEGLTTVSYEEKSDDGDGIVRTSISIEPEKVTVRKSGDIISEMCFAIGETFASRYVTLFGTFPMEIVTKNLQINKEETFLVCADYLLMLGGAENNCSVKIEITRDE